MNYIEVNTHNKKSIFILKEFYYNILKPAFPEDELDTYNQLLKYLKMNDNNSYHILIFMDKDIILGGIIYDYFINTNTGLIEYIVTNNNYKRKNIGSNILKIACNLLNQEAISHGFPKLSYITCEVEKITSSKQAKHYFWEKHGFIPLDFTYLQPPLDRNKKVVKNMDFGIITKAHNIEYTKDYIDKEELKSILKDYTYQMTNNYSKENKYYEQMIKEIDTKDKILLKPYK